MNQLLVAFLAGMITGGAAYPAYLLADGLRLRRATRKLEAKNAAARRASFHMAPHFSDEGGCLCRRSCCTIQPPAGRPFGKCVCPDCNESCPTWKIEPVSLGSYRCPRCGGAYSDPDCGMVERNGTRLHLQR